MKTEHTPEPWSYGEDNDGWYVEKDGLQIAHGLSEEDARRIVACVNACEDILDYELSLGCVARLSEQLRTIAKQRDDAVKTAAAVNAQFEAISKQRDELLAAAEQVCQANNFTEAQMAVRVLNTAITRMKGGSE